MHIVVDRRGGAFRLRRRLAADAVEPPAWRTVAGAEGATALLPDASSFARAVAALERAEDAPRWTWATAEVYPLLLAAGVRVRRAHDPGLVRAVLRRSVLTRDRYADVPVDGWDGQAEAPERTDAQALFDIAPVRAPRADVLVEFERQLAAIDACAEPGALRLLANAESAGALVAAEMRFQGLPWRADLHEALLERELGPRVPPGVRPARLEALAVRVRAALGAPGMNPDSGQELLRALRGAGLPVESTRAHELERIDHPVVAPLLEYKKRSRLATANGWFWLDTWVRDGRFRPDYVVGGVVTGRWATSGGGAMQLPKQVRAAVVADPGWRLVVADAAQLEPRVLAAMAGDTAMAAAGRGADLYAGIAATGVVPDRTAAKYGVLGALYGATQGTGGRLVPRLAQQFPRAIGLVEEAARTGERGGVVRTRLGRTSPDPGDEWRDALAQAAESGGEVARRAASRAREQGRFTRNFVVQGTAAEWALCWMADLRARLEQVPAVRGERAGPFAGRPHLVYFLHDELLVHAPSEHADRVADAVRESAAAAGRLLFGAFPIDFPLDVHVVERYSDAK